MRFKDCYFSSGSVRQLTSRKGKPWQATLKYKEGDKWKSVTKMLDNPKGKKDAEDQLFHWQKDMEERASISQIKNAKSIKKNVKKTVVEMVEEYLNAQRVQGLLEESTYVDQLEELNTNIKPYLSDIKFTALTSSQVREWLRILKEDKHLKNNTVIKILSLLKKTYRHYITEEDISYDPCAYVTVKDNDLHIKNVLDAKGKAKFLMILDNVKIMPRYKTMYKLALYTGMRTQELCGLTWGNVNFVTEEIRVVKVIARARTKGTFCYVKKPKEKASKRIIPLLPQALETLREQYNYQLSLIQKEDRSISEMPKDYYVCGLGCGKEYTKPQNASANAYHFFNDNKIIGTTGKPISLHDLRHTFATDAVASKMDIKSISSVIGHANAAMTLDVYATADEDAIKQGMRKFGDYISRKEKENGIIDL